MITYTDRWMYLRSGFSMIEQAWVQFQFVLPPGLTTETKAVSESLRALRDAFFRLEREEARAADLVDES